MFDYIANIKFSNLIVLEIVYKEVRDVQGEGGLHA